MQQNFKEYEMFSILVEKVMVFLNDFNAGILSLGWIINANNPYDH